MNRVCKSSWCARLWIVVAACSIVSGSASPQARYTGVLLQGTVRDPSGAVVPGATLTMSDDATKIEQKTTTDQAGRYIFTNLGPASYTMTITAPGFKTLVRPKVVLSVGQQTDLDLTLEVGSTTTVVEVKAAAPVLNSASAELGQVVENRLINDLPILGRQVINLPLIVPGVTEVGDAIASGNYSGTSYVSNGQRGSSADVRMDGATMTPPEDAAGSGTTVNTLAPTPEIVQEFKMQLNSFSAEYGDNGGTVVNVVTKSGTNNFHGSGYWFFRRPQLDASDFFSNRAGNPKPNYKRDEYGGSIGGPIIKQKTFFFFDYDRTRLQNAAPFIGTVPTALERQGDFSQVTPIYDPFGGTYTDASGNVLRNEFQYQGKKDVIPPNRLDPLPMKLVSLYPLPTNSANFFNFTKTETSGSPTWEWDIKVDHNFSEKSRITGRFSRAFFGYNVINLFGNPANPDSVSAQDYTNDVAIEHTYTLNATTIWTNRFTLDRAHAHNFTPQYNIVSFGFSPILLAGGGQAFPRIDIASYSSLGGCGYCNAIHAHTLPDYFSGINKIKGAHNLKFGFEHKDLYYYYWNPGYPTGDFPFDNTPTAQNVFNPGGTGNGMASFLLGWNSSQTINIFAADATKSTYSAFYGQDDWRITNHLTLNAGLRYEWDRPYNERYNRIQYADFNADSGASVPALGELHGVSRFTNPSHRTPSGADTNNFAPRLGFAYRLGDKTVLRGGGGVYYFQNPATNNWLVGPAFNGDTFAPGSLDGNLTQNATFGNPFPKGLRTPQGNRYGLLSMWGLNNQTQAETQFNNGEIYQWNFGVQRELPGNMLFEVDYSASRGTHLPLAYASNRNFVSAANRVLWGSQGLSTLVSNPFYSMFQGPNATFNEPTSTYNNPQIPRLNLLRPFPQFDGGFTGWASGPPEGNSRYNSLQIRVEKRYSNGLFFLGGYAFSKYLDNGPGANSWLGGYTGFTQDPTNKRGEWSISSSDTPHRLVWSGGYELPVGHGKRFGSGMNRWLNGVVGNWQVNGILTFQSGLPLHFSMYNARLADGSQRPNITGNPMGASIKQTVDGKGVRFNASAFSDPGDQMPGSAPRYSTLVRGDGIRNLDFSVFKKFPIRENMELQFRGEFFDFTNTPRFGTPDTGFGSPTFGEIFSQYNSPRQTQLAVRFVF